MNSCVVLRGEMLQPVTEERRKALARSLPGRTILENPTDEELRNRIDRVEIVFGELPHELLSRATALKWWQLQLAGVDSLPTDLSDRNITVTNASGTHAEAISEHLLAMMLGFARDLPGAFRHQAAHQWEYESLPPVFELSGKRVLLLGTGAIGTAFARKADALGMTVVGVRRSRPEPSEDTNKTGRSATPGRPRQSHRRDDTAYMRVTGTEAIVRELPHADFLVITLPLTSETRGMIGERELGRMHKHSFVLNIGRGPIINQTALVAALRQGTIAGAGLDVFDPEPLPEDSPLWDMSNVILTTHYAGVTPRYAQRLWSIFLDNADRYVSGRALTNVVDFEAGY